jgi:hypothetical protein
VRGLNKERLPCSQNGKVDNVCHNIKIKKTEGLDDRDRGDIDELILKNL